MGRVKINSYLDVIVTHPELTVDELEEMIREEEEKSKQLTEWPEIL